MTVSWFVGFSDNSSPVGSSSFIIPPDFTVDFGSRNLPSELTVVNSVPNPELVFDEGRAIVSSRRPEIGVSARVYYRLMQELEGGSQSSADPTDGGRCG